MTALVDQRHLDLSVLIERTGISARTWRRLIAAGEIGVLRIGGSVRIPESELEALLQRSFIPAVVRRSTAPVEIEDLLDRHIPRKRRMAG